MHRFWLVLITVLMCALTACAGKTPDNPDYWKNALSKANSPTEKVTILGNLRKQKPQDAAFLPLLHAILSEEKSPDVKVAAVRILADMKSPSSLGPLQNALAPKASGARARDLNRAIVEALVALNEPTTEATFLEMLKTKDNFTLFPAIEGLVQLRSKQAVPFLLELLDSPAAPPNEQAKYIAALGQLADPSAIPALEKKLFTLHLENDAALALFRMGKPAADAMLLILQEKNTGLLKWAAGNKISSQMLMANAASVLGDMQDLRAENILIAKLTPKDNSFDALRLRQQAIHALGRMRSTKATTALSRVVLEQNVMVRNLCVLALAQIGDKTALAALKKAASVDESDFDERLRAMTGIALLGDEAELAFFNKQMDSEHTAFGKDQVRFKKECGNNSCDAQIKRLGEQRMEALNQLKDILETSSKCAETETCWAEVLADTSANSLKRQRAALFLGRSKNPQHMASLGKQLADADLELRMQSLLAISWLVRDNPQAARQAKTLIQPMQQQMDEERGSTQKSGVRDEMWRVLWTLQNLP
ncbi:MAG: HEAT repeat domain-containing protein [Proteobacteria bacterium]|nr:HEAT repeat domain-containing protein [Cystobacterineae bacterium]MCL2259691.1 HEAT repeat domain-containing protein [Cystobacterineae bacterium]MCL2313692.1 HEAT repeat domain-containing protein [Pseudomonadota bacterium]